METSKKETWPGFPQDYLHVLLMRGHRDNDPDPAPHVLTTESTHIPTNSTAPIVGSPLAKKMTT